MEIVGKDVLSALMKALYVAKWEADDENAHVAEIVGSPYVADVFNRVVDELIRLDENRPGAAAKWARWRSIEDRPEQLERVRARIKASARIWETWGREQRLAMLDILLSPFTASTATRETLVV